MSTTTGSAAPSTREEKVASVTVTGVPASGSSFLQRPQIGSRPRSTWSHATRLSAPQAGQRITPGAPPAAASG